MPGSCDWHIWRRGRDSNPRWSYPHTRFPSVLLRPLGHLSQIFQITGGEEGIRTLGPRERSTVFETAPIDHSGTSPQSGVVFYDDCRCLAKNCCNRSLLRWASRPPRCARGGPIRGSEARSSTEPQAPALGLQLPTPGVRGEPAGTLRRTWGRARGLRRACSLRAANRCGSPGRSQDKKLRVRGGVSQFLALIPGAGDDFRVSSDDRTHGDFSSRRCRLGLLQRFSHEGAVVVIKNPRGQHGLSITKRGPSGPLRSLRSEVYFTSTRSPTASGAQARVIRAVE